MRLSLEYDGVTHTADLTNDTLVEHLKSSNNPIEELMRIVDNGYITLQLIPPSKIPCGCCHKIDGFTQSVESLTNLVNTGGNSSKKGKLCEILVEQDFKKMFPGIEYKDTSGIDRSGDAIVTVDGQSIMIDLKDYDQNVPSSETDKLVRDLKVHDMSMGILYSVRSKISKQDLLDFKIIDDKLIVFIAGQGINAYILMIALKFIIQLQQSRIISISDKVVELTNKAVGTKLKDIFNKLFHIKQNVSRHNEKIDEILDKIAKLMNSLKEDGVHILSQLNCILEEGSRLIEETHQESMGIETPFTEILDYIEATIDKKKDKLVSIQFANLCRETNIQMGISDTDKHIHLFKEGNDIGKLKITKTCVTFICFNKQRGSCSYNNIYEEVKNGDYHIQLTDIPEKWDIIRSRFE